MPSKSPEQKKFMQAVANNPKFAEKVKVPVKVGKEFVKADKVKGAKMKSYRDGGIYTADMGQPPQDIDGGSAPPKKPAPKKPASPKKPEPKKPEAPKKPAVKMAKGGSIDGIAIRGKTNCKTC
jgi:hypothetical protein